MTDYRELRWGNLNTPRFRHLKLLLYWPVYGLLFLLAERGGLITQYTPVYCPLDDAIPFCEYFVIPYLLWFAFLVFIHLYTLFFDVAAFKKLMWFIIVTYSITIAVYFLFPTCQELRPAAFERDNIFTRFLTGFYQFDTNTNVCPSIHVIGSVAVMLAAWDSKGLQTPGWKAAFGVTAFLISISTVFLKQHSILDVFAAVPVCVVGYLLAYRPWRAPKQPGHKEGRA